MVYHGGERDGKNSPRPQKAEATSCEDGQRLYVDAKSMIPGGTQLLSKRPEMFAPGWWPPYYKTATGCEVVDADGQRFIDMSLMGVGACLLGYNDPDVTDAVIERVRNGSTCTLNNPEEVELARLLVELHPWAGGVRYARAGGEAMAMAVRIARARTRRDVVAFCGYHGWQDWYLAANIPADSTAANADNLRGHLLPGLHPRGVPTALGGTALPFRYNQLDELAAIVRDHGSRLAAVVMEPTRSRHPDPGFLEGVRQLCDDSGAILVIDEITAGWRLHLGGAHLRYGLRPDIAVFAKAIGNGHPMAAVIGTADVMQAAQESFISSTAWSEGVGPAAALATIRKMQRVDVPAHVTGIGERFRAGLTTLAAAHGVPLRLDGHAALTSLTFAHRQALAMQTLFTVRMLDRGFLASGAFYPSLAHETGHVDAFLAAAADHVFGELATAMRNDDVESRIGGPVKHTGFARLT
jgi:glutamate-1-semialdehyde 2,1-aminomutase